MSADDIDDLHEIDAKRKSRQIDRAIAVLADGQHGVVSHQQLLDMGLGRGAIEHRLRCGRLYRLFPGAYSVGTRNVPIEGRWLAAVFSCGPGAVLSHRSAGAHWGVRHDRRVEVTAPRQLRPRKGLKLHLSVLPFDEVTVEDGIPVTTVPRTILDLATVLPRRQVEQAMHEVEGKRLYDRLSLPDLVERYPRRRGVATIKAILAEASFGADVTDSALEEAFLDFCAESGLPRPETQVHLQIGGRWVRADALFRAQRLIVELDSHAWHSSPETFESDRVRDRELAVLGWRVVRVTWRELQRNRAALLADLLSLLSL